MKFPVNFQSLALGKFLLFLLVVHCETLTKSYSAYRPFPLCNPSDYMRYPQNYSDVIAIVNEAIDRGVKVKALGARHSQTDIICTEGIPVDMTELKFYKMNEDNETASFGPGVTIMEAGEFLLQNGRALRTTAAFGHITLGGAIGTGAHGSTIKYNSTISAQVVSMTVVNGLGQTLVVSDPDDLNALKINLGLLGIVVEITLYTVPLYKVKADNYVVSDNVLTNGEALNLAKTSDQITFYWYPAFKKVVVAKLTFVPADTPGNATSNAISPPSYGYFNLIAKSAKEIAYNLASSSCTLASTLGNKISRAFEMMSKSSLLMQTPGFVPIYTSNGYSVQNPAVGYPHSMFATVCDEDDAGLAGEACFWAHGDINASLTILDNEFCLDLDDLPAFVTATKDIVSKTPTAFPLTGIIMRFSGKSDVYMSTSYRRNTVHVEFGVWKRTNAYKDPSGGLAGYQTILQTMTKTFTGRSHWGKSGFVYHNRDMLDRKLDSTARDNFIAAMNKFDPNGIFLNNFGLRITKKDFKIDSDPLLSDKCALLDTCFCAKNSDCGDTQQCTTIPGYTYPVCKTKNEVPDTFNLLDLPPLSGSLIWLNVTVPILANTVLNQCSLLGGLG